MNPLILKRRVFTLTLLLGPKFMWTPLRPTLGRLRRQITVRMTLVTLVPLLVFNKAWLLAITKLLFIRLNNLGNRWGEAITFLDKITLFLLHPLMTWGPIPVFEQLGDALKRVTNFIIGMLPLAPVGKAVNKQLRLLNAILRRFTLPNLRLKQWVKITRPLASGYFAFLLSDRALKYIHPKNSLASPTPPPPNGANPTTFIGLSNKSFYPRDPPRHIIPLNINPLSHTSRT